MSDNFFRGIPFSCHRFLLLRPASLTPPLAWFKGGRSQGRGMRPQGLGLDGRLFGIAHPAPRFLSSLGSRRPIRRSFILSRVRLRNPSGGSLAQEDRTQEKEPRRGIRPTTGSARQAVARGYSFSMSFAMSSVCSLEGVSILLVLAYSRSLSENVATLLTWGGTLSTVN